MDDLTRLKLLTSHLDLEPAEETGCPALSQKQADAVFTHSAQMPNGQQIRLLKTLLSSACERNCNYCPFRAGRDFQRATFKPEEFASLFMTLLRAGAVQGLFISSGLINGGMHTQDLLLDTAAILRERMGFRGYLHLKLMPGAEKDQVLRAMQLADRVSINLEAPTPAHLAKLAPRKNFVEELLQPLRWVEEIRRSQPARQGWNGCWPSSTTQFVVGGVGETDLEYLSTTEYLHRKVGLKRAYFSRFKPIADTPLQDHAEVPLLRQNRLYQASFLLRDYGFGLEDLPFTQDGSLPLDRDPKLAWAQSNLSAHPVEVNRATREELLKVPGLGPKSVTAILKARQVKTLRDLSSLNHLGVQSKRAADYILLDGHRPLVQHMLW